MSPDQLSLQKQSERLALLANAASELSAADEPQARVRGLIEKAARHLGAEAFLLYAVDESVETLSLDFSGGVPAERLPALQRLEFGGALHGTVARTRRPLHATHIQSSDHFEAALERGLGIRACCCHPLMAGERLLGTLSFATRNRNSFDAEEVEFIQTICHFVTIAKEVARQAEEIERLRVQLQGAQGETFYRVKNNLHILSALVDMAQRGRTGVPPGTEFQRLSLDIQAMAAVHEVTTFGVGRADDPTAISAAAALERLVSPLTEMAAPRTLTSSVEDARLPMRLATPFALCTSELVYNALKHGRGAIHIGFSVRDGGGVLEVTDEGDGFPPGFDAAAAAGDGLDMINCIVRWDFRGSILFENRPDGGARVAITLPLPDSRNAGSES